MISLYGTKNIDHKVQLIA